MKINLEALNELKLKIGTKAEMSRALDISKSHLDKVLSGNGIGLKVIENLRVTCIKYDFPFNQLWLDPPIILKEIKVSSIEVVDKDNNLLASISSNDVVTREDIDVVFND